MRQTTYDLLIASVGIIKETLEKHGGDYLIAKKCLEQCQRDIEFTFKHEEWNQRSEGSEKPEDYKEE